MSDMQLHPVVGLDGFDGQTFLPLRAGRSAMGDSKEWAEREIERRASGQPVTPLELGDVIRRLQARGFAKGPVGFFEVEVKPRHAVYVIPQTSGETVADLQVIQDGRCASRGLTADQARHIAALLLAAAGDQPK
jgi:hypothetical protein